MGAAGVTTYTYDSAERLATLAHNLAGTAHDVTFTYNYNPAGQITSRQIDNSAFMFDGFANVDISDAVNDLN